MRHALSLYIMLLVLVACGEPQTRVVFKERIIHVHDPVPCLYNAPEDAPILDSDLDGKDPPPNFHGTVIHCMGMSPEDCWEFQMAAWSDYGHRAAFWQPTAWDSCRAQ